MTDGRPLERKALIIMTAISCAELVAIWAALRDATPATLDRILTAGTVFGWMLAPLAAIIFVLATLRRLPEIRERLFELSTFKVAGMIFGLLAAFGEELWFRKIPMDWLERTHRGPLLQLLAVALLFGVAHAVWGAFARQWRAALAAMTATAVLGGVLGLIYLIGGRAISPCIFAHAIINLVLEPWLLFAVLSRKPDARERVGRSLAMASTP